MEDNENYTYSYRRDKLRERQRLMYIVLGGFAVLLIIAAVIGAVAGNKSAVKQYEKEETGTQKSAVQVTQAPATQPAKQEPKPTVVGVFEVDTEELNIRSSHSMGDNIIGQLSEGDRVTVIEVFENSDPEASVSRWGRISYNGQPGWVAMYLLKEVEEPETVSVDKYTPGNYKTTSSVRLRSGHSTSDNSIETLDADTLLTITEIFTDSNATEENVRYWGKTSYGGNTGWVSMYYLTPAN